MLKNLLVGDNSFIGVSHLSQERARERTEQLDVTSIVEIIETATACGASGYTFSTHPINLQILDAIRTSEKIENDFGLYPVLPYAQGYVRLANEKGIRGLADEMLSRLSLSEKAKAILSGGLSALKLDPVGIMQAYVDIELRNYLDENLRNVHLRSVLLHEVITDLCLGIGNITLLEAFAHHVVEKYHVSPGFVTYNLTKFIDLLHQSELNIDDVTIMTPFNSVGYQMSPSRSLCESCLSSLSKSTVIAMSVMAGGYLNLEQAYEYLSSLPTISGIAVGVSSKQHASQTFQTLGKLQSHARE